MTEGESKSSKPTSTKHEKSKVKTGAATISPDISQIL